MARAGVHISGINQTIRLLGEKIDGKRQKIERAAKHVSADFLRKSQDNAPLQEGTLAASGSEEVKDLGRGKGFLIVVGFDTPYALRMHESKYNARQKMTAKQKRKLPIRRGGPKEDVDGKTPDDYGLLGKRGRKYMSRAWRDNKRKWTAALERSAA